MPRNERVTRIIDGDTFMTASRKRSLRLANVDTPERRTRGGAAATKKLKSMIGGKTVSVDTVAHGPFGRAIVEVKIGGRSVNRAMKSWLSNNRL